MAPKIIDDITIRDFTKADQKPAQEFCEDIFTELEWPIDYADGLSDLSRLFNLPQGTFLVATLHDKVVACGGVKELLKTSTENIGLIKRFFVIKELRGKGLASQLLEELINRAKKKSFTTLVLDTGKRNEAANGFYPKYGFKLFTPDAKLRHAWTEAGDRDRFNYYSLRLS